MSLVAIVDAAFVHVALAPSGDRQGVEITRTRVPTGQAATATIRRILDEAARTSREHVTTVADAGEFGVVTVTSIALGYGVDGVLTAASRNLDFPNSADRVLLRMGADEIAIGVDRWHTERHAQRLGALVEHSSDFIATATLNGIPSYVNPAALGLLGLNSVEEARGKRFLDFVCRPQRERVRSEVWPTVMRDGRWTGEIGLCDQRTGTKRPFLIDWFRIDDIRTGAPMNIAAIGRNLVPQRQSKTQIKRLRETLEQHVTAQTAQTAQTARLAADNHELQTELIDRKFADARWRELQLELFYAAHVGAAAQMAGALAHELNQPLTAATNFIHAARRLRSHAQIGSEGDLIGDNMAEAAKQMVRAAQIIGRFRSFARRSEAEMRVEPIATLVADASGLALVGIESRDVNISIHCAPEASRIVGDRIQIRQLLVNLLRNAIEAMADSPRRELLVSTELVGSDTVEIAVSDTGTGLPSAVRDRLFEPFVSTTANRMGLGLSICRSIVEAHGGRINAEPKKGGGTTIRFTLPGVPGDDKDVE